MAANILDTTRNYVSQHPPSHTLLQAVHSGKSPTCTQKAYRSSNIQSLYTVLAAWTLSLAPHLYAASLGGKAFDNRIPRAYASSLKDNQTLDATTKRRIARAEGAQQNGFENVGLFAAAVVAGNGTAPYTLNVPIYVISSVQT